MGSKGRYGSFHSWINLWVVGKTETSLTRVIPEHLRGELLITKRYTNRLSLLYFKHVATLPFEGILHHFVSQLP